jgi:serine/threonine protein kinase
VFGPWQLIKLLGEGSMGRVYLGHHTRIGRDVAVKVLRAEHAKNREVVSRFLQEATAVNAIKNDHIVEVYDYGEDTTWPDMPRAFCVMELLDGRSLAAELSNGPLPVQRACRIAQQVARALAAAHAHGVVHRDVKPENLFLSNLHGESDYVKVLDFGVAKLCKPLAGMPVSGTVAGAIIGTPDYMAPEQAQGLAHDSLVDIYSLGLVLYEALTGRRPFQAETFGQLVVQICTAPLPAMGDKTPAGETIPKALQQLVSKCLEKEPARRWQSAEELAAALEPFATSRPQRKRTLQRARWVLTAALAGVIASVGLSMTSGSAVASVPHAAPAQTAETKTLTASAKAAPRAPDTLEAEVELVPPSPSPASAVLEAAQDTRPTVSSAARKSVGSKPAAKAVKAAKKGFSRDRNVDPFAD